MGLKIHSLGELPIGASREYFLYLLDYGWEEPLGRALRDNFDRMAEAASRHDAVVLLGLGNEFNDQVLSWHGINGDNADDLLPAILITNKHPATFDAIRRSASHDDRYASNWDRDQDHLVIIPLRDHCKTPTDFVQLIIGIFDDIKAKKTLATFAVAKEDKSGVNGAILDAVILRPSVGGMGIDLKKLLNGLLKRRQNG